MAIDYDDISEVNKALKEAQDSESDNRDRVREMHNFLDKPDGQWEPNVANALREAGRPLYTFDKLNPEVDKIAGEMEGADFDIRVRPAGGEASKEDAKTLDGLIRNIEIMSNASRIYSTAGREMVSAGLGGWEVAVDWADNGSFEQDLMIRPIPNYEDRVWFDTAAELQDMSDARHVFVLQNLTPDEYKSRFPKGSLASVGTDRAVNVYSHKVEFITVGRILYKKAKDISLALMSDGAVYEVDEDFEKVRDDLAEQGITVERERVKKGFEVVSRLFDGQEFLTDQQVTVFDQLPIIPTFGNFKVRESKILYRGAIDKLIDAQRAYNYSRSREIEEVALAPKPKYWGTRKQFSNEADRNKAKTLNTNSDPVQLYEPDDRVPGPPVFMGGAVVNPGLQGVVQNSLDDITTSSGQFNAQGAAGGGPMSGIAIQKLENIGNNISVKYFKSQEVAICQTARVLVAAIPKVYDTKRQARVLGEDGSFEMVTLNDQVFDQETGEMITLNDLSKGKYDVTCDVGPAFKNRQMETVKVLQELSAVIPGVGELSADVQMTNINSPGVDIVAERLRAKMINNGSIPETQWTNEEKEQQQQKLLAAQQQPQQPTPEDVIAEAESRRVEAETAAIIQNGQLELEKLRILEQKNLMDAQNKAEKLNLEELTLAMKQQLQQSQNQQATVDAIMKGQAQVFDSLNTQANTLKTIREAMGVDAIVGPHATEAFIQQAETITDQQDAIQLTPETDGVTGV